MKPRQLLTLLCLGLAAAGCVRTVNTAYDLAPLEYRVVVESDLMVPMSDGVRLATDLYRPQGLERAPVILMRTPYGKQTHGADPNGIMAEFVGKLFARHGYMVVIQDTRGRYGSEGEWDPFVNEVADGHDALAWAASQPWSTGKVATWGGSYHGFTQWALADDSPRLAAMVPYVTSTQMLNIYYEGGAVNYVNMLGWHVVNRGRVGAPPDAEALTAGLWTLPLIEADNRAVSENVPAYDLAVSYQAPEHFDNIDYAGRHAKVSAPILSIGGWYDLFQKYQIEDFTLLREVGQGPAREESHLVIGPWGHGFFADAPVKFDDGGISKLPQFDRVLAFYDERLKGEDRGMDSWPPYIMYVMGANEWRGFEQWPPPAAQPTKFYLGAGGRLSTTAPGDEAPDHFTYDPADPVPTLGGPLLGADLGPKLQAPVEARDDVLVYTTEPMTEPLTITGPLSVTLLATSDAKDTDFTAKLCDLFPDGKSINISDGIVRARYRNGDLKNPELIEPGQVYEYEIDLWHTAYVFLPGHSVRLQISSSNFPRFDRNRNTGDDVGTGSEMRPAKQIIHHDSKHPSRLILPVAPGNVGQIIIEK